MLTLPMTVKMSDIVSSAAYKPQQEPQERQQQQPQQQQPAGDELEDVQSALLVTEYLVTPSAPFMRIHDVAQIVNNLLLLLSFAACRHAGAGRCAFRPTGS
jgi:hypothetical protein